MPILGGRSVSGGSGYNPQDYEYRPVTPEVVYGPPAPPPGQTAPPPPTTFENRTIRPTYRAPGGNVRITSSSGRGDLIQRTKELSDKQAGDYVAAAVGEGASSLWDGLVKAAMWYEEKIRTPFISRPLTTAALAGAPGTGYAGDIRGAWNVSKNISPAQAMTLGVSGFNADADINLEDPEAVKAYFDQDSVASSITTSATDALFAIALDPAFLAGKASKVVKLTYFARRAQGMDNTLVRESMERAVAGNFDPIADPWHAVAKEITSGRRIDGQPMPYDRSAVMNLDVVRYAAEPERAADFLVGATDEADAVVRLAHLRGVDEAKEILREANPNAYFEAVAAEAAARPYMEALETLKGSQGAGWRWTPDEGFKWDSWVGAEDKQKVLDRLIAPATEDDLAYAVRLNSEARETFEGWLRTEALFNTSVGGRAYGRTPRTFGQDVVDKKADELLSRIEAHEAAGKSLDDPAYLDDVYEYGLVTQRAEKVADGGVLTRAGELVDKAMGSGRFGKREARKARRELNAADTYWYGQGTSRIWKVPGLNRTVVQVKRAFDEMPNGYVPFKGAGAEDAVGSVKASIRNVPLYSKARLRNKQHTWQDGSVSTGAERARWIMDEWARRASNTGVTREEGLRTATLWLDNQIWNDMVAAKGFTDEVAEAAMREYQKVRGVFNNNIVAAKEAGGFWTFTDEAGNAVSTHDPVFASQMDNGTLLLDHRKAWDIMDDDAVAQAQGYRYKDLGNIKADATAVGDALLNVWKPLVLLRGAYPIRNGFEGQTRFLAQTGGLLNYMAAVFSPGSTKRTTEAASAARRSLDQTAREIDAFDEFLGPLDLEIFDRIPMAPPELKALAAARNGLTERINYLRGLLDDGGTVETPLMQQATSTPPILFEEAIGNGATGLMPVKQLRLREDPGGLDPSTVTGYADDLENGIGFDKPILMVLNPTNGEVRLADGLHRYLAAESVGVSHVPVRVVVGFDATGPLVKKINTASLEKGGASIVDSVDPDNMLSMARPSDTTAMPLPRGQFKLPDGSRLVQARVRGRLSSGYQRVIDTDDGVVRQDKVYATPDEAAYEVQGEQVAAWTERVNDPSIPALPAEVAFPGQRWTATSAGQKWDDAQAKIFKQRLADEKFADQFESTIGRQLDLARGRLELVDGRTREILTDMGFIDGATGDLSVDWRYLGQPQKAPEGGVYAAAGSPSMVDEATVLPAPQAVPAQQEVWYIPQDDRNRLAEWANALLVKADLRTAGQSMARQAEYWEAAQGGKLGRGRGMSSAVDRWGHTYEYGGMFSDARAGKLVEREVSSESTTMSLVTSESYASAYKKAGRDFVVEPDVKIRPSDGDQYWEQYAKVLNHHWRGDPAMRLLLDNSEPMASAATRARTTLPQFYEFLKSSAGQRYVDLFDLRTREDAARWWFEASERVDSMLPTSAGGKVNQAALDLRARVARGEEVGPDDVRKSLEFDTGAPVITGDMIESMPGTRSFAKGRLLGSLAAIRDKGFKWLGTMPEDYFTRRPYAHWAYEKHMRQLIDQRGGTHIRTDELADMQRTATKLAVRDSRQNLYTIIRKRRAFEAVRFGAAFAEAQFNSFAFWARTLAENPDYVARIMQLAGTPARLGLVDHEGNVAVPLPAALGSKLPGSPTEMSVPMSSITSLYFNTGNRENPLIGGVLPSPTPLIAVPASEFVKSVTGQQLVERFGENPIMQIAMSQVLGDTTQSEPLSWNRAAPAWMPKAAHLINSAVFGDDSDGYMMAAQIQAFEIDYMRWQMAGGQGQMPQITDDKYKSEAQGMALLRIATNLFSPLAVQWGNADHKRGLEIYQGLTETYGPQEADQVMLQMFPEYVGLMATANTGGGISSRASTNAWIGSHGKVLADLGEIDPEAGKLIVPWAEGEFQEEAYVWQKSNKWPGTETGIRRTMNAEDSQAALEERVGMRLYRLERDRLLIERQQNGVEPGGADWKYYQDQQRYFLNSLMQRLPAFAKKWQDEGAKQGLAATGLQVMNVIAESDQLADSEEHRRLVDAAQDYLTIRDKWVEEAADNGEWYYEQNEAVRTAYERAVEDLERSNPMFSRLYSTYFFWDDMSLRSDGSRAGSRRVPGSN